MRGILRECGLYLASAGLYLASARGYIFDFILGPPFLIFRKHSFSVPRTFVVGEYLGSSKISEKTSVPNFSRECGNMDVFSISYQDLRFSFSENTAFQSLGPVSRGT